MIELRDIYLDFNGFQVLSGIDLKVAEGESVALVGTSGSGKTTLLKVAVGLLKPQQGRVWLAGENITDAGRAALRSVRRQVGMLFQGNALFDSMNVRDNVGFVLKEVLGLDDMEIDRRVGEILDILQLGDISHKMPSELSGGMKKRVGIARAIISQPKIVLYDDPTAGLDPITSDAIADLIRSMRDKLQATSIVVSNQMAVVKKLADRVVMLRDCALFDLGSPDQLQAEEHFGNNSHD